MIVFGLTGGSGAGKSTASAMFGSRGITVLDADKIARDVTEKGSECLEEIKTAFSAEVINSDGTLNRRKLGKIVFNDGDKLKCLNAITHKYIRAELLSRLSAADCDIAAIDGAVIIGSEIEKLCKFMVSVIADREIRIERITARDGISRADAENRLNSQPDDDFYTEHSAYVITNNGNEAELKKQVDKIYSKILENEV